MQAVAGVPETSKLTVSGNRTTCWNAGFPSVLPCLHVRRMARCLIKCKFIVHSCLLHRRYWIHIVLATVNGPHTNPPCIIQHVQEPQLTLNLHHRPRHQSHHCRGRPSRHTSRHKNNTQAIDSFLVHWLETSASRSCIRHFSPWYTSLSLSQAEGCSMSALAVPLQPAHKYENGQNAQPMDKSQGLHDLNGASNANMSQSNHRKRASSGGHDMKRATLTKRESSPSNDNSCEGKDSSQNDDKKPKKRRKVNHACVYCRRSHMTCDSDRPCSRCKKRDIGHLCHDEPRDLKKMKSEADGEGEEEDDGYSPLQHRPATSGMAAHRPHLSAEGQIRQQINPPNNGLVQQIGQNPSRMPSSNGKMNASQPFGSAHQRSYCSKTCSIHIANSHLSVQ